MKKRNQFFKEYSLRGKLHPEAVTASGITLISLIVTIIILLILAGVSLKLIAGGNGILGKAEKAVNVTNEAAEKEIIQLAYLTAKADYWENGAQITKENLKEEIQNSNKKVEAESCNPKGELVDGDSQYAKITFEDTRNWYVIDLTTGEIITSGKNGEITKKPMQEGNVDIWDLEDLQEFQALVNNGATFEGYTVRLMADIDVSSICGEGIGDWTPIGNAYENETLCFKGNFEGRNHMISSIYINNEKEKQGFFGNIKNGKICDLTVEGSIKATHWVGGIAGRIENATSQIIENCTNNIALETTTDASAGGIVGNINNQSRNVTIDCCINNANVKSEKGSVGGIIGTIYGSEVSYDVNIKVSNCTNNGRINSGVNNSGGIVGIVGYKTGVIIENCKNTNTVITANSGAGGIVGAIENSADCTIRDCSNSGDISSINYYAGGILGSNRIYGTVNMEKVYNSGAIQVSEGNFAGGIIGGVSGADGKSYLNMQYAYNQGSVYAKKHYSGGICGGSYNGGEATIANAYNEGAISVGEHSCGGIIGSITKNSETVSTGIGKISYCHNAGKLTGTTYRGGIVGNKTGTYTGKSNYWLSTCGATYGIGSTSANTNATKYTEDQMKVQSNFADWDFDTIWEMDEAKGYPILRNMPN